MSDPVMKKVSLAEIRKLKDDGKLFHDPNASEGEALGADFWAKAHVESLEIRSGCPHYHLGQS